MNLSVYSLQQLEESRHQLIMIDETSTVLTDLKEKLSEEIQFRTTTMMREMAALIQRSLTTLNQYTPKSDADEAQLYHAWRAVQTALDAIRPVSQPPKPQ